MIINDDSYDLPCSDWDELTLTQKLFFLDKETNNSEKCFILKLRDYKKFENI